MDLFLVFGIGGPAAILAGALALGIRHGIDWDHIAAITDITSATTVGPGAREVTLVTEPAIVVSGEHEHTLMAMAGAGAGGGGSVTVVAPSRAGVATRSIGRTVRTHRQPFLLGTVYALGHGSMVIALGLVAILFSEILPSWVDPVMESVVGVTLIFLSVYLFYSLYRFFRGGEEFRIRSRWMLVFAGVANAYHAAMHRLRGEKHSHEHVRGDQQYGIRTSYGIGLLHGIGAETGTQVLIIGAAVGAGSKGMGVATLFVFVFGILIANSIVTVATTLGFVSAQRRQAIYVVVGAIAAVFSLALGLLFLFREGTVLPSLDPYFRWIGGPG